MMIWVISEYRERVERLTCFQNLHETKNTNNFELREEIKTVNIKIIRNYLNSDRNIYIEIKLHITRR